jgi:acyl carrier protein
MQSIQDEVRAFVIENFLFGQEGDSLRNDASLLDEGIIDSTGVLELLQFLEEKYGIAVEDRELVPANLDSVLQVASFVERKLNGGRGTVAG